MAFFRINFYSETLRYATDVNVILPTPGPTELPWGDHIDYLPHGEGFQTLYLLHGAYGDCTDWPQHSNIETYAQAKQLAVIMPSGGNSFYQDMYRGDAVLSFLTGELPRRMEGIFPLATGRENTFAAGMSMGGYGAVKLAFTQPERFGACASLSGVLDLEAYMADTRSGTVPSPCVWDAIFPDPDAVEGTAGDLFALMEGCKQKGLPLPMVYQACGREDFVYKSNRRAKQRLEALGLELTYEEGPGAHDWDFWDPYIRRVLDWLPLAGKPVARKGGR